MESLKTFYTYDRAEQREWLSNHFEIEKEIWFVFPLKEVGKHSLSHNDAVEEALCFGWIDSTVKKLDSLYRVQRFTPRKEGSGYSRANIERLIWLEKEGFLHPKIRESIIDIIQTPYVFPKDIIKEIQADEIAWNNYITFSEAYKRIRIAYIDSARKRPLEF